MARLKGRPAAGYAFAVSMVALAAGLTWIFPLLGTRIPFALFYAAVVLSAWYGGLWPGLLSVALSALASAYLFLPPQFSLDIGREGLLLLGVFVAVSLAINYLTDQARRAGLRARESREQLLTTLRSIGDAVIVTDSQGRVTFMNEVAQKLTGWTQGDALSRDLREVFRIVNESTRQEVESPAAKVMREGTVVGLANHTVLIARDGRETPIDDSGAPIRGEDGEITGVVLVFRDIHERRQAEDVRRRLAAIVESSDDAIIGKTLEGVITTWNQGAAKLYGYSQEEAVGRNISMLVPPDRPDEVPSILERLKRGEHIENFETRRVTRDGKVLDISLTISPIKESSGAVVGASTIARDITERKRVEAALGESRESLRQALEAARLGMWEWDIKTGEVSWSDTLEPMHGMEPGSFGGSFDSFNRLVHPEDRELVQRAISTAIEHGSDYDIEFRIVRPDGAVSWIQGKGRAFHDHEGKPSRMTGLAMDITERKQAEEALRASEDRYRAFVRNSTEAIWRFELDRPVPLALTEEEQIDLFYELGYLAECNDVMAHMYGFARAGEIVGSRMSDLLVRDDPKNVEYLRSFIRSGYRLTEAESHEVDRNGNPKFFLNNLVGIVEDGALLRAWGTQQDITGRRRAEEERAALLAREQQARRIAELAADRTARLQAITAALSEALTPGQVASAVLDNGLTAMGADAGSIVMLANHGSELELLGAVGFPPELLEKWRRFSVDMQVPLAEAVRSGRMVTIEDVHSESNPYRHLLSLHAANGTSALAAVPLTIEGRAVGGMGLTFRKEKTFDEYDRAFMLSIARQCAQAIERARLYQAERRLRAEAEEANRMKDEFLATLSHELRTPLTAMLGWTRMLRTKELDQATSSHALETVERNAKVQAQLIEDLLDVSRIITGKLRLEVGPVDLVPVVEAAIDSVRPAAEAKAIRLETSLDPGAGPVQGDAARLQQVVWNLVSNAVKFTQKGGQVSVRLRRTESRVEVLVSDTGQGISPEFLPFVFDRFRQADSSTTRQHGGLGLGLAIVRHLVELHGGSIHAESDGDGHGATFRVELPALALRGAALGQRAEGAEPSAIRNPQSAILRGLRLLVVDDERDSLELMKVVLEEQGASVVTAPDATGALALLGRERLDLVISDIGMPGKDGYSLIRRVRERSSLPAAAVSAYVGEENRQKALDAGFQVYVTKPIDPEELIEVVRQLTGR